MAMARITKTEPDSDGVVRCVELKIQDLSSNSTKLLQRPINKIVLLVENDK